MNDVNLNGVTKDDFIEFVAATFFRVQAALSVLYVLQSFVVLLIQYYQNLSMSDSGSPMLRESLHRSVISSITSCISSILLAALLFFLAVPLARLVRRSLSQAWEPKPLAEQT